MHRPYPFNKKVDSYYFPKFISTSMCHFWLVFSLASTLVDVYVSCKHLSMLCSFEFVTASLMLDWMTYIPPLVGSFPSANPCCQTYDSLSVALSRWLQAL